MEALSPIENLITAIQAPGGKKISPADGTLGSFEQTIDKIVTTRIKSAKDDAQAGLQFSQKLSEFEKKIAFYSGQLQQAQTALAALEGQPTTANSPNQNQLINSKKQEVFYWSTQLHEAGLPDSINTSV
jgi:hypothetical protein